MYSLSVSLKYSAASCNNIRMHNTNVRLRRLKNKKIFILKILFCQDYSSYVETDISKNVNNILYRQEISVCL